MTSPAGRERRLLVLGGTGFVGRVTAMEAVAAGWQVTVCHRGSRPSPQGTSTLVVDRVAPDGLGGLDGLATGEWDLVIDTWSAQPSAVAATARLLAGRAEHYVYVSSRSVYAQPCPPGSDESAMLVEVGQDESAMDYAECKLAAERSVLEHWGPRAVLARAGLILGPHEDVGRLPWWLGRIARGGTVVAPGPVDLPLQYIDARDLAHWMLTAPARGASGPHNLVSKPGHTTMGELLAACIDVTGSAAELRWLEPEKILEAGVAPWTDLPIWLPPGEDHDTMHTSDVSAAHRLGLQCRDARGTVADTWAWLQQVGTVPQRHDRPAPGLSEEAERRLLAAS